MRWWKRSTPVGAALLAAMVLSGCGTKVPLDLPPQRSNTGASAGTGSASPTPPPASAPAVPMDPPSVATPMPVAPSAAAAQQPSAATPAWPGASAPSGTSQTQAGVPLLGTENSPLATETRWLQQWFDGTPVVIAPQGDGTLLVEVPAEFCFDVGASAVKPPLAAVLTRVRSSLERHPSLQMRIETPPEVGGPASLARERSTRVREHFFSAAISPTRITEADGLPGSPVRLVINGSPQ